MRRRGEERGERVVPFRVGWRPILARAGRVREGVLDTSHGSEAEGEEEGEDEEEEEEG